MVPEGVSLGYARACTRDHDLESQRQQLIAAGCYDVYADQGKPGATVVRPELDACLRAMQPGNTLVVTQLDRLGRTVRGLAELLDTLKERKIAFRSLAEGIDTTTMQGRMMFGIIASVAEMERELIRERTMAGLGAATGKGGRPPRLQPHDVREARRLREHEEWSLDRIAEKFEVSRSTIIRALRQDGLAGDGYAGKKPAISPRETTRGQSAQNPGSGPNIPG
ncbi:recombinase family protein [Paeniglutamicibacter psychrophenolicus]|uniref:DNA invertase Pin-like site-specific DNA recombinase n=1 Tax=Paeniglutamicibacter psychrophenolicus TaxID=257454 RepID=A0ABS4WK21_9MICC|nr:recombinase family protein [Paeniglutamicibacter psychrophenolicus]MBP2376488.1 DNA invertase Pin-like site-specific DNA recombinase [Paeniglutamicibacter psychrophenolicus]